MGKLVAVLAVLGVALVVRGADPISYDVSGNVTIPALDEDTTVEVASGVTVTNIAALTGSGKLTKTGAGTLVLSVAAQNFIGGIEIQTGVIDVLVDGALGTGDIDIVGTTTDKRQLHFGNNTAAMTVPCRINVNSAATATPAIFFDYSKLPNEKNRVKKVTLTGGIYATSNLYINDQVRKSQGTDQNYVVFDCPVDAAGYNLTYATGQRPYWKGVVRARVFISSGSYGGDDNRKTGEHFFYAANEIGEIRFKYNAIHAMCEHCFDGSVFNWSPYTSDSSSGRGSLRLGGYPHVIPYLTSAVKTGSYPDNSSGLYGNLGNMVTITGATDVVSATAYCALRDGLSLTLDAADPSFVQELAGRTHSTTGGIVVKCGTLKTSGIASFAGLSYLRVEGGCFAYTSTVETAFAGLTNLTVKSGATASFSCPQTDLFPTDGTMDLILESGASLTLPEGMTEISVRYFYLDGRAMKIDDYTRGKVPVLPEGVTVHVTQVPADVPEEIIWTGGAGTDTSTLRAANWGLTGTDLDFDGNKYQAVFSAADAESAVATVVGSQYLNMLTFANGDFIVNGEDASANLNVYGNGIVFADDLTGNTAPHAYSIETPLTLLADATIAVPANDTFSISNGLSSAYSVEVKGNGQFNLSGGASVAGQLKIGQTGSVRLSGRITSPNGADTTSDPSKAADCLILNAALNTTSSRKPIVLDNVVIEKPLRVLSSTSTEHFPVDVQAAAGSTNVILSRYYNSSPLVKFESLADSLLVFSNAVSIGWTLQTRSASSGLIHFAQGFSSEKGYTIRTGNVLCDKKASAASISFTDNGNGKFVCGPELSALPRVNFVNSSKDHGVDLGGNVVTIPVVTGTGGSHQYFTGTEGSVLRFTSGSLDDDVCKAVTNLKVRVDGALGVEAAVPAGNCLFLTNQTFASTGPLIASRGVLELAADAVWSGTRIVATGVHELTNGTLRVNSAKSISKNVAAEISGLGKFEVPAGVTMKVASLTLDGEPIPLGTYDKTSPELEGHILGDGQIVVGRQGLFLFLR